MTKHFSLELPIIQAPMAGGISTVELAFQVCQAGGLGFLAGGYKPAETMLKEIKELRMKTDKPFGINLFVPDQASPNWQAIEEYRQVLEKSEKETWFELGDVYQDDDDWERKLSIVIEEKVPVVSFTFGCPSQSVFRSLKANGQLSAVTITNAEEARTAYERGADFLCLQGQEAGGHRATFQNEPNLDQSFPLLKLIETIRKEVPSPIIAAGGLMNGKEIYRVLTCGADYVQLGTAFLLCRESGTSDVYKKALRDPAFQETSTTRAFTGRPAKGLVNQFMKKYSGFAPAAYPYIHQLTQKMRKNAAQIGNPQYMSLWAGDGYKQIRELSASDLLTKLKLEMEEAGYTPS
ncbi:nitronate monooxygenase [Bacillus massiliglaciei]|uniref:nitronate monooxygenase n=1 Tax=Bacillus massiliglaciei TaxID=1816693 RepID=UPI000DA6363C|nr:nitronate monooxygenase [Bacillus massiliglaciei]